MSINAANFPGRKSVSQSPISPRDLRGGILLDVFGAVVQVLSDHFSDADLGLLFSWSWIELRTERESLLQVLNENANFGGHPAAGRPHGKDWRRSLKSSQKTDDSTFSEFCREEPCWRLGNYPDALGHPPASVQDRRFKRRYLAPEQDDVQQTMMANIWARLAVAASATA